MYKDKKIIHIVCMDELGGIGKDNKLLFDIPEDLKYFRDKTLGHSCLCGRNTYNSFPRVLSRRIIHKLGHFKGWDGLVKSDKGLLELELDLACDSSDLLNTNSIYIIGGASIYNQTYDIADELFITIVDAKVAADTFYTIPDGFVKAWESETQRSVNGVSFKHSKWKRSNK